MNRRETSRSRRRLRVRLEPGTINSVTGDLGAGGAFVYSHRVLKPGTALRFQVQLPDGKAEAEGIVRWAKRVPSQLTAVARGGMGIEFTWVSDELRAYLEEGGTVLLRAV